MKEDIYEDAQKRLIFALDVSDRKRALYWVDLLKEKVGIFKIGLELFLSEGKDLIDEIRRRTGAKIFLDLKFHDIPATVLGACYQVVHYNVDFITVHAFPKAGLFNNFFKNKVKILGVTVLTSLGPEDLIQLGIRKELAYNPERLVLERAKMAKEAGCAGIVCSGREVKMVKGALGKDFIAVTPGIRLAKEQIQDQKRVVTPFQAVRNGADYLVIGRSIRMAKDPLKRVDEIIEEIIRALSFENKKPPCDSST